MIFMQNKPTTGPNENTAVIAAAEQRILQIRQEIYLMGANSSEFSDIDFILQRLHAGDITPEDAIIEAEKIESSKTDYH